MTANGRVASIDALRRVDLKLVLCSLFAVSAALAGRTADARPDCIRLHGARHAKALRRHSGIPSIAVSPRNGRLWATWYTSTTPGEDQNTYCVVATSGDGGTSWKEAFVVDPDGEGPRKPFEPLLFVAPDGRLRLFWTEATCDESKNDFSKPYGGNEGIVSTMVVRMIDLNAEVEPRAPFNYQPRTLCRGVMACKPIILGDGAWVLPVSWWGDDTASSRMFVSTDGGKTFAQRGGIDLKSVTDKRPASNGVYPPDEPVIFARGDGSLRCFLRAKDHPYESVSADGGRTWSRPVKTGFDNVSARIACRRLKSGKLLLVKYGPIAENVGRSQLTAYLSDDDGATWRGGLILDERKNVSYPDLDQRPDGTIFVIWDRERLGAQEILFADFTEADVLRGGKAKARFVSVKDVTEATVAFVFEAKSGKGKVEK